MKLGTPSTWGELIEKYGIQTVNAAWDAANTVAREYQHQYPPQPRLTRQGLGELRAEAFGQVILAQTNECFNYREFLENCEHPPCKIEETIDEVEEPVGEWRISIGGPGPYGGSSTTVWINGEEFSVLPFVRASVKTETLFVMKIRGTPRLCYNINNQLVVGVSEMRRLVVAWLVRHRGERMSVMIDVDDPKTLGGVTRQEAAFLGVIRNPYQTLMEAYEYGLHRLEKGYIVAGNDTFLPPPSTWRASLDARQLVFGTD